MYVIKEALISHSHRLNAEAMHPAGDETLTEVITVGVEEMKHALALKVQLQGHEIGLVQSTGTHLLEVLEFSYSGWRISPMAV